MQKNRFYSSGFQRNPFIEEQIRLPKEQVDKADWRMVNGDIVAAGTSLIRPDSQALLLAALSGKCHAVLTKVL